MQVLQLLEKFNHLKWIKKPSETQEFQNIQWKIQDCTKTSILFLKDSSNSEIQILIETITEQSVGLVIVDSLHLANKLSKNVNCCLVESADWMELQFELTNFYYPISAGIKFAAVTGTNGKTSTVNFLSQLLSLHNQNCLSIGTLGIFYNLEKVNDVALTSPSYIDFRKIINQHAKHNDVVIFEMSSHALAQMRFYKTKLTTAAWTSFSQDHLDFHKTMENYFESKKLILDYLNLDAVLFIPNGQNEILKGLAGDKRVIVTNEWNDYKFEKPSHLFQASFAKDNFILAYEMLKKLIPLEKLKKIDLSIIKNVPGRWMLKSFDQKNVIIDYAHTPDALKNVCQNAKQAFPKSKLKVLFGCGGDRDRSKRPLMAQAVSDFADYIYVTSDNPRTEDANAIIDDIIPGIKIDFYRHPDREQTLKKALLELQPSEVLIVAGKGHEDYIIKGTTKFPYSDEKICDEFMTKKA